MRAVRWFAFYSALETVFRSWDALVTYFANHRNDAKAVAFLKKLTQVQNVATMYYLMDVIPWLTQLNQIFQKEVLDVSIIRTCISTTLKEIGEVKKGNGFYTKKLTEICNRMSLVTGIWVSTKYQFLKLPNLSSGNQEQRCFY